MFTPLRRFELGKMMLNLVTVLVAAGVASKLFTEFTPSLRIILMVIIIGLGILAFFVLPKSMAKDKNQEGKL